MRAGVAQQQGEDRPGLASLARAEVLVTGATGFLGRHLLPALQEAGARLTALGRRAPELPGVAHLPFDALAGALPDLRGRFDYAVHLLARSNDRLCADLGAAIRVNVEATARLLQAFAGDGRLRCFLFPSTATLYADGVPLPVGEDAPRDPSRAPYSLTKALAEDVCAHFARVERVPVLVLRLGNVYGPDQDYQEAPNLLPQVIWQALTRGEIEIWNAAPVRDWVYVADVVAAFCAGLARAPRGTVNIGSGAGVSAGEIARFVAQETGARLHVLGQPVAGPMRLVLDVRRAQEWLGWAARTPWPEGVRWTIAAFRARLL